MRAMRNRIANATTQTYEEGVNAFEKVSELMEDPDNQMIFMDPNVPVFVFINEKTGATAILGDPEIIPEIREELDHALAEALLEKSDKASLN